MSALILAVLAGLAFQSPDSDLKRSLVGSWTGFLEYRDYSEPATSAKRVKLPTWLTVHPDGSSLRFEYIYDDGPSKTVTDASVVRIDMPEATYTVLDNDGKVDESYSIEGLAKLREGRGTLILTGKGTENKASVDVRTTLRIERNIMEIIRETAPAGQPFAFRHAYTFVRAAAPAVPSHAQTR